MTLCDSVKSFGPKITENYRETRFCDFAPPDETVGVIDVSAAGNGSPSGEILRNGNRKHSRAMKLRSRTS